MPIIDLVMSPSPVHPVMFKVQGCNAIDLALYQKVLHLYSAQRRLDTSGCTSQGSQSVGPTGMVQGHGSESGVEVKVGGQ